MYNTMHLFSFVLVSLIFSVSAWNDDDLEVFDVYEEVNQNFYELLGVSQEATPAEIKSAFKKLTLKLHPDKNDSPDADVQFRNLVSVHNILKDPGKREKYNEVLRNGLPNWRSAVYYYRHARKIGLAEGALILLIIISFGQYAVGWAAYIEKRYTAEQILTSRVKKNKKTGFDTGLAEILDQLPKPSLKDTLPFQIPRFIWWSITGVPYAILEFKRRIKEKKEEEVRRKKREEEERKRLEAETLAAEALKAAGGTRRRRAFVPPERQAGDNQFEELEDQPAAPVCVAKTSGPVISGGFWSDEDLAELVRLVKKYPGGTADRWERIAEAMQRSVPEVTHMAAKMKENCYKLPGQEEEVPAPDTPKKVKTRKADDVVAAGVGSALSNWSQTQQKALEASLAKYPKGGAGDRWEKIANSVPGKTREECMMRCKYLSDLVKRQKQKDDEEQRQDTHEVNGESETAIADE